LSSDKRRKKRYCPNCWSQKDMGRRKPKRLKTGDKPDGEVVKVKVGSREKLSSPHRTAKHQWEKISITPHY
jgi:hypothetical protein